MWNGTDVVLRRRPAEDRSSRLSRVLDWMFMAVTVGLSGCGAMKQDVHRYYRQMATNYQEAEEKAKFEAITLEADSRGALQAGNLQKYNRTQKDLDRVKNWEARCASQRQRFEKAARKLEPAAPAEETMPPAENSEPGTEHSP